MNTITFLDLFSAMSDGLSFVNELTPRLNIKKLRADLAFHLATEQIACQVATIVA